MDVLGLCGLLTGLLYSYVARRKANRTAQSAAAKKARRQGKARWQVAHEGLGDPALWSVENVCLWLKRLGLGVATHKIRGRHIDGKQLLWISTDDFVKMINRADTAGDVDSSVDGTFSRKSFGKKAVLDKAARRALTFLQCDFDPRRLEKFEVQQLRVDKKDTCVLTRPPSAQPSLFV